MGFLFKFFRDGITWDPKSRKRDPNSVSNFFNYSDMTSLSSPSSTSSYTSHFASQSSAAASIISNSNNTIRATTLIDFFFIAQPAAARTDDEAGKKLMYYWPKSDNFDQQIQCVGFAEAVITFTKSFAQNNPIDDQLLSINKQHHDAFRYVSTAKQQHVYVQLENDAFIIGVALNRVQATEFGYTLHASSIRQVLMTAYDMFRLFFGTMTRLVGVDTSDILRDRLDYFFTRYLSLLRLHTLPIIDLFAGVDFMTIDSVNFLRGETTIARLCQRYAQIERVIFLYQDRLISYTVPKSNLAVLFRYLTQNLLPMSLRAELQPESQHRSSSTHHHGKYITGPIDSLTGDKDVNVPIVYLNVDDNDVTAYHLIVYRALNATICLFISGQQSMTMQFFRDLDAYLGPELTTLASQIGDACAAVIPKNLTNGLPSINISDADFHFVFFNPSSLSLKSSFIGSSVELTTRIASIPPALYGLLCELSDEIESAAKDNDDFGDVFVKTANDWWISAKQTNDRILFLIFPQRSSGLTEVSDEVKRITRQYFDSIFLNV